MKRTYKLLLLNFLIVLLHTTLVAQESGITIVDNNTSETLHLEENRRIRIKTVDGQRLSGRFTIIDKETIMIKDEMIPLTSITKIKKNPLLYSILVGGGMIYIGGVTAGFAAIFTAFAGATDAYFLLIPAAALIYGGIKSPNILKGYELETRYSITINTN